MPIESSAWMDSQGSMREGEIHMVMTDKALRIQMLGGFSAYYGDKALTLNKMGSSKSIRLLQMLLLSRQDGIPKGELLDSLYGWNEKTDTANRNKNLNNLIYRLKGQLMSAGLPDDEYVEIRDGRCCFKCRIPQTLDTQRFEAAIENARAEQDSDRRMILFDMANDMYRGELLPSNLSEMWFYQKSIYYKELYLETVRELEQGFRRKRDYKNLIKIYSRAASIYPFENWQTRLIRCNLEIYRYDEALELYNDTMELYAREMGTPPTAEMQECFENVKLMDKIHVKSQGAGGFQEMDRVFMEKKNDIKNAIFSEQDVRGAYYCTYPSFVDYCRLVVRSKVRTEFPAVLMFLTLSEKRKQEKQMDLQEQMGLLKQVIGESLRIGDAYTRYGNRHFILMLTRTVEDACIEIFRRIENGYSRKSGKGSLWYYTDLTQSLQTAVP